MQAARKPNSVLGDHSSRRRIATPLQQPTRKFRHVHRCTRSSSTSNASGRCVTSPEEWRWSPCLFGLAPCGVYRAVDIAAPAVGSYPTLSPLPQTAYMARSRERANSLRRFAFCCTGRPRALKLASRTLSGTLPCGVRTFLPRATSARQRSPGRLQEQGYRVRGIRV